MACLAAPDMLVQLGKWNVSIHSRPVRRLTPQPTDRGRADRPFLKGGVTKKDFIGSAVLSTYLFPLKGEVSNHKGICDEKTRVRRRHFAAQRIVKAHISLNSGRLHHLPKQRCLSDLSRSSDQDNRKKS